LLDAHRAFTYSGLTELTHDCILRGGKAAEFALSLLAALGVSKRTLGNARLLFPFFHFLMPPLRDARPELPRHLRGQWDRLQTGELVAADEDLQRWRSALETATNIFAESPAHGFLPHPAVQVTAHPDGSVRLTRLAGDRDLKSAVPSEISHRVKYTERENQPGPNDEVLLLGHFDAHGLAMMAASYLHLRTLGVENIMPVCGYEETGDYGKFWKRILPRLVSNERRFTHAVLVDITVYSRDHGRTIRGLESAAQAGVQVHLVDHHLDTLECVPEMLATGAEVVLADIPGCFYGDEITQQNVPYCLLGAMGDRDIAIRHWLESQSALKPPMRNTLDDALSNLTGLMHSVSPPPREFRKLPVFPARDIVESVAGGVEQFTSNLRRICEEGYAIPAKPDEQVARTQDSAFAAGQHWFVPRRENNANATAEEPEIAELGAVLLVTQQLPMLGRGWYDALEKLISLHDSCHYALAGRYLTGRGFNFLCLKDWRKLRLPPPLAFVPEDERGETVGHYGAFWFNLGDVANAESKLTSFIKTVNRYLGVKGGRVQAAVRRTLLRILDSPPKANRPAAEQTNNQT